MFMFPALVAAMPILATCLLPGVTDSQAPAHVTQMFTGLCLSCLCPFPFHTGQQGADLKSIRCSVLAMLCTRYMHPFSSFPVIPSLLSNNQVSTMLWKWQASGDTDHVTERGSKLRSCDSGPLPSTVSCPCSLSALATVWNLLGLAS